MERPSQNGRSCVKALAALLALALTTSALAQPKVYKIGIITAAGNPPPGAPSNGGPMPIKDLLAAKGYKEGVNVLYEFRAGNRDQAKIDAYARELVAWQPDLIIGQMTNANIAVAKATSTIPVVFWSTDPVESGYVKSFSKPGTNFTGFSYEPDIQLLQLRVLKLVKPDIKKVAHLYNHTYAPAPSTLRELKAAGAMMGIEILVYETLTREEITPAFAKMKADGIEGVTIGPHELFNTNGPLLGGLAQQYKLPMIGCCQVSIARGGALASYSPPNGWPVMADRIDEILKGGAKPQDLPVVRWVKSPLTLNLKGAAAIGVTVPESLIDEAQTVIR